MNIEIANRLYQYRKKNNLSQEELAAKIGVSRFKSGNVQRRLPIPIILSCLPSFTVLLLMTFYREKANLKRQKIVNSLKRKRRKKRAMTDLLPPPTQTILNVIR